MVSTKILSSKTVYIYLKPLCIMHFKHILNALIVPLMHLTMHCYHIYTVYNIYLYTFRNCNALKHDKQPISDLTRNL